MQGNDAPRPRQHNRYDFLYNVQDVAPYRPDDAVINMIIYIYTHRDYTQHMLRLAVDSVRVIGLVAWLGEGTRRGWIVEDGLGQRGCNISRGMDRL
jgi:hypothetical protein